MPKCYAKYGFSIGVWERDGLFICLFIYFSLFLYTFCYIYKLNIYIYICIYIQEFSQKLILKIMP